MSSHIYKCENCKKYTMKQACSCGRGTLAAKPLKYGPGDNLEEYRRRAKAEEYSKRGLI